jgi:hypothetical protein
MVLFRSALALFLCVSLWAETRMSVEQLRAFVSSSRRLGHSDKQLADYLKRVKLSERLEPGVVEDMQADGTGPKTLEALRELSEESRSLPAPQPPAPKPVVKPIPPPTSMEQGRVLDQVTEYARGYTKSLPNFICTQVTRRYADPTGMEFWQRQDVVTAKLSFFEQKEDYKIVLVNNRYMDTTMDRLGGSTSTGEFGSMLKEVFAPETQTAFEWERWATLRGRRMHVFSYRVAQPKSNWSIVYERQQAIKPGYSGLVYVDRDTLAVMRLTLQAENIPASFPIQRASTTLDYDFVDIAGTQYVLPLKATVRMRSGKLLIKNDVEFRAYNRFGAEAVITYEPDPIPEEQLREEEAAPAPAPQK